MTTFENASLVTLLVGEAGAYALLLWPEELYMQKPNEHNYPLLGGACDAHLALDVIAKPWHATEGPAVTGQYTSGVMKPISK